MKNQDVMQLSDKELSFAIEGKYTNIRVWKHNNLIYIRLDRYNQYSCPLSNESILYLEKPNKIVSELLKLGGFSFSDEKESEVIVLLRSLKKRDCLAW